ncbi:hypothetical protein WJX74_007925 [Apatococcus lobatus]|uniref:Uncharacterized protein n=1 Tax=Apatococcus lobatus TaxID=904363 RepID=A0AAW1R3G9_9CHLO
MTGWSETSGGTKEQELFKAAEDCSLLEAGGHDIIYSGKHCNRVASMNTFIFATLAIAAVSLSPAAGQGTFDWGRPCTLKTSSSSSEILPSCTDCGSGASAKPQPSCTFSPSTVPAGTTVNYAYHSSTHNLFIGSSPCAYTTEICPSATAAMTSPSNPCKYTFKTPGTYYVSDKASDANGDFCGAFGAQKKYTVT